MIIFKIIFIFLIICIFNSIVITSSNEININNNNNNYPSYKSFINKYKNDNKNRYNNNQQINNNNNNNNNNHHHINNIIINEDEETINNNEDLYEFKNSNINFKKINHNYQNYNHLIKNNTNPACNQNIILKDWGFQNLGLAFQENNITTNDNVSTIMGLYWLLSYPLYSGVNISFVEQLQEAFFSTDIQGYSAIKISSLPGKPLSNNLANIYLKQIFQVNPDNDYQLMFEISSTQVRFSLFLYINDYTIISIEPTGATFDRVPYRIPLNRKYLSDISTISLELSFFNEGLPIPPTYIENIRMMKIPNGYLNTVFVSNSGSDATGDGTVDNPFSSIQQAVYYLEENDEQATILVLPGYYCGLGNSFLDFSTTRYLTLTSYSPMNKPIISGEYYSTSISFSSTYSVNLVISNLEFIKSSIRPGGSSIAINGNCTLQVNSCQFDQHYGDTVLLLNYLTLTYLNNCTFLNNTQYAIEAVGVFGLDQISISSSTFYSINSLNILNIKSILINGSNFYYNDNTPLIDQQQCPLLLDKVNFGEISHSLINTALCIYRSNEIYGNHLLFNNQPSNIFIQAAILSLGSNLYLSNTIFSATIYYSCISAFQGVLHLKDSSLLSTGSKNSIIIESNELQMYNVEFLSESIIGTGGTIVGVNLTVIDSTFITAATVSLISIYNSTFISVSNLLVGSSMWTTNCVFTQSENENFQLISSNLIDRGSYIYNNSLYFVFSTGATILNFTDTIIENNMFSSFIDVGNNGAIYMYNIQFLLNTGWGSGCGFNLAEKTMLSVYNGTFRENYCHGPGGIVNIDTNSALYLKDCVVSQNSAGSNGGIIYSGGQSNITIDGGFYLKNYLNNGSLGVFIFYYDTHPIINSNVIYDHQETIVLGKIYIHTAFNFYSIQSGSGPYEISISFLNYKNEKLNGYEFEKDAHLYISLTGVGVLEDISLYKMETRNGSFFVTIDQLTGQIDSTQTIFINSDSPFITSTQFSFQFLPCPQGYYPNEHNNLCISCPYGTYGINSQCLTCPDNTICYGGATIAGLNGYWVYTNGSSLKVYECPPDVCYQNDTSKNTSCAPYSDGILCAGCVEGYYNCGSGCKKEDSINKFVLVIKIIMFFVLVITQQWSSDNSGLITIALYFMQTLAVISSGIKFSVLTNLSGSNTAHSGRSNSIFSVLNDCLGPFGFYWNHYFILLQPVFLFVVLIFIIIVELLLRKTGLVHKIPLVKDLVEKTDKEFFNRQFSTFIKVCMNSYGPFATEVLLILFCESIGPFELLNANPAVTCSGKDYDNAKKITYGLISILVLFPILIFILLYRIKNRLDDKDIERIYGVFYLKYIPKLYFWDVTLLLKRLSIVTVSLIQFQSNYRSVILVTLGLIYLFVHLKFQPFISDQDNNLETVSLILLFISCIYLDNGLYQDTEQWILIICVVSFLLAAIKFQSKYLMNEFNTKIYPILKKIYDKITSASPSLISTDFPDNGGQYKVFYEESDNEDDEISNYAYDSQKNVIKVIDKKSNYYNFVDINGSPNDHLSSSYTYGDDDSDNDDFISSQIKRRV